MTDNAPENVSETEKLIELGVLHSLTKGIQEGVATAMMGITPLAMITLAGGTATPAEYDKVLNVLTKQLALNYELAGIIEELMPFDPTMAESHPAIKQLVKVGIHNHVAVAKAREVVNKSPKEKLADLRQDIKDASRKS